MYQGIVANVHVGHNKQMNIKSVIIENVRLCAICTEATTYAFIILMYMYCFL